MWYFRWYERGEWLGLLFLVAIWASLVHRPRTTQYNNSIKEPRPLCQKRDIWERRTQEKETNSQHERTRSKMPTENRGGAQMGAFRRPQEVPAQRGASPSPGKGVMGASQGLRRCSDGRLIKPGKHPDGCLPRPSGGARLMPLHTVKRGPNRDHLISFKIYYILILAIEYALLESTGTRQWNRRRITWSHGDRATWSHGNVAMRKLPKQHDCPLPLKLWRRYQKA